LAIAITLDTATQMIWKSAVADLPDVASVWDLAWAALQQPKFLLVVAMMLAQFGNWMLVLKHSDLSFAHAVTALSYVTVAIASVLWMDEHGGTLQAIGIALIMAGVWLVSRTGHLTSRDTP
jgi:undecaprenyl phosphate-alpha-L-ara4N flippase subunit ArnF